MVQRVEGAEENISGEVGIARIAERVDPYRCAVAGIDDDHVVQPALVDPRQDLVDEVSFRIDDDRAPSGRDVTEGELGEQGALADTRRADNMEMA